MSLWTHRMFSVVSSRVKMQDKAGSGWAYYVIDKSLHHSPTWLDWYFFITYAAGFLSELSWKCDTSRLHATDWPGSDVTAWVIRLTASQESNPPMMVPRCPPLLSCCDHSHIEVELSYNGKWPKLSPVECSWAEWVLVEKKSALPLTRNIWLQNTHLSRMIALK